MTEVLEAQVERVGTQSAELLRAWAADYMLGSTLEIDGGCTT